MRFFPRCLPRASTTKVGLAIIATLLLSGCTLRLDLPPDALPSLSPSQTGISAITRSEKAIGSGADTIANDSSQAPGVRAVAEKIRRHSASRLAALGGVWNPWPQGKPHGAQSGPPAKPIPRNLPDLIQLLVDNSATACRVADAATDTATTTLLVADCAANQLDAKNLAAISGTKLPVSSVSVSPNPFPDPQPTEIPIKDQAILDKLQENVSALDFSRYRLETAAAFMTGDNKSWALSRAQTLSWEVQSLIDLGAADLRTSQYPLNFSAIKNSSAAIQLVNRADADAFIAELGIAGILPPAGKNQPERRQAWIEAAMASAQSQSRFGIPSDRIFSPLWP